jgi:hypothetical protein
MNAPLIRSDCSNSNMMCPYGLCCCLFVCPLVSSNRHRPMTMRQKNASRYALLMKHRRLRKQMEKEKSMAIWREAVNPKQPTDTFVINDNHIVHMNNKRRRHVYGSVNEVSQNSNDKHSMIQTTLFKTRLELMRTVRVTTMFATQDVSKAEWLMRDYERDVRRFANDRGWYY